jgi:hypothetical protein
MTEEIAVLRGASPCGAAQPACAFLCRICRTYEGAVLSFFLTSCSPIWSIPIGSNDRAK